jgi:hypothetical protein
LELFEDELQYKHNSGVLELEEVLCFEKHKEIILKDEIAKKI